MARSDLLLTLVRAGIAGDKGLVRATAEALAADERAKKHVGLADKLTRLTNEYGGPANGHPQSHSQSLPGREFTAETTPRRTLTELVLTDVVRTQVDGLVEEQLRADLLRSHGLQPRHRVLLSGPPGNGKTALAEAIAEALAIPFFVVRYDALIGSYLGETTQRLRRLFDYVRTTPCVLLFDEFDAIGKERGDVHETGEIKRVVSSLLLQIDALPAYVVVIAATNHAELLDRAVWRRFQLRLTMPMPTKEQLSRFLGRGLATLPDSSRIDASRVASALFPVSYAEASEFLIDVRRRHVLSMGQKRVSDLVDKQLPLWSSRAKVYFDGQRSQSALAEIQSARPGSKKKRQKADPSDASVLHVGSTASPDRPQDERPRTSTRGRRRSPSIAK